MCKCVELFFLEWYLLHSNFIFFGVPRTYLKTWKYLKIFFPAILIFVYSKNQEIFCIRTCSAIEVTIEQFFVRLNIHTSQPNYELPMSFFQQTRDHKPFKRKISIGIDWILILILISNWGFRLEKISSHDLYLCNIFTKKKKNKHISSKTWSCSFSELNHTTIYISFTQWSTMFYTIHSILILINNFLCSSSRFVSSFIIWWKCSFSSIMHQIWKWPNLGFV